MVNLVIAVVCSTLISLLLRFAEGKSHNRMALFVANYAVCLILAVIHMGGLPKAANGFAIGLGAGTGVLFLASFILLQTNISKNGVILSSTFMKLGVLIPTLAAIIIFKESPRVLQIIGFILAIVAIIIMNLGSKEKSSSKILLPILLVVGGVTDSMVNVYDKLGDAAFKDLFLACTFGAALVCSGVICLVQRKGVNKWDFIWGAILGIPNYYSSRFLLGALSQVQAVIVYPVYSVGTILLLTVAGLVIFKEKLKTNEIIALVIILGALVLLNV